MNTAEPTAARDSAIRRYAIAALIAAAAVGVRLAFDPILGLHSPFLIFPIAILLAARFGGRLPGLAATLLCAVGGWYFLTNPPFTFEFKGTADAEDIAVFRYLVHLHQPAGRTAPRIAHFENQERTGCETK